MAYERDRGNFRQRGYTSNWDKAAATFKARYPWCIGCKAVGRNIPTALVDHVEPHKGDQKKVWDTKMWQPLCRHCHDVVKFRLERAFEKGEVKVQDLWLTSAAAIAINRKHPPRQTVGLDGWPET